MKKYSLLGENISYSLSPVLHGRIFDIKHQCGEYTLSRTPPSNLSERLEYFKNNSISFNVTIPYKQAVMPFLDDISEQAVTIGAVNTVKCENGKMMGFNTDVKGITFTLKTNNFAVKDKNILIYGGGGGARSAIYALQSMGVKEIYIYCRSYERACKLAQDTGTLAFDKLFHQSLINGFINCTPIGTLGNNDTFNMNFNDFSKLDWCFDMVYNPSKTLLFHISKSLSIPFSNGLTMLAAQGAEANAIWTGESFSRDDILALREYLRLYLLKSNIKKPNIALCGFMAAGKTTIGKELASILEFDFIDSDSKIEKSEGMTISDIFKTRGENHFRDLEREFAEKMAKSLHKNTVFSLGGGFVFNENAIENIKKSSILVFLDTPFEIVEKRLKSVTDRPLSSLDTLHDLYDKRYDFYRLNADIIVNTASDFLHQNLDTIISSLEDL